MIIRYFLNKLLWDPNYSNNLFNYNITYIHRGAPKNRLTVNCREIVKIHPDKFEYNLEMNRNVLIPYHRITRIMNNKTDEIIYEKNKKRIDLNAK
ncbi:MAG: RNA repair domain-containing protein [Promethearchaeota archaeon]